MAQSRIGEHVRPRQVSARALQRRLDVSKWEWGDNVLRVLILVTAVAFLGLALAAHRIPYFAIDLDLTRGLQSLKSPTLDSVMEYMSWPGFPPQSNILFGGFIAILALCRRVLYAIGEAIAAGGSAVLWFAIAPLVNRPRPSPDLVHVSAELPFGSFPSGHVLNLLAALGFAWYLAYTRMPHSILRTAILVLLPIYVVLLGLARIYTGQHWPSDVVGGLLLGALWLWLSIGAFRVLDRRLGKGSRESK